jgi:hypothetical protein
MIIYNVTISIDHSVHDDWIHWMRSVHIPDVMATGHFLEHKICKVLVDDDSGITYSIQYTASTMEDLEAYQKNEAPRLQKDHSDRYKDKFVAFRTLLEVLK